MDAAVDSCIGKTRTAPELSKIAFPWYLPFAGPSDASAVNPGMFIRASQSVLMAKGIARGVEHTQHNCQARRIRSTFRRPCNGVDRRISSLPGLGMRAARVSSIFRRCSDDTRLPSSSSRQSPSPRTQRVARRASHRLTGSRQDTREQRDRFFYYGHSWFGPRHVPSTHLSCPFTLTHRPPQLQIWLCGQHMEPPPPPPPSPP
jgi:hypothetical protein